MKNRILVTLILGLIALVGCAGESEVMEVPTAGVTETAVPTATPQPTSTPTAEPSATPTDTPTPAPTDTPTLTPTTAPLTSKEVFNLVSPSVAYVETDILQGSGILLEGGMILTNAHVVWPFDEAQVIFPDGTEFENVPVANRDLLADLAVLGPIETDITPVKLIALEELDTGSDVYLIGYPGEVEDFPQPSITRGLISRVRNWEPIDVTYYQTDAKIGDGQSGGMLVTEMGEVIGVSSFRFSDADFGLVASARDILPRVQQLLTGEDIDHLQTRGMPTGEAPFAHSNLSLNHEWDMAIYVIDELLDTEVDVTVKGGRNDVSVRIYDVFGSLVVAADQTSEGDEWVRFRTELEAPYFAVVQQYVNNPLDSVRVESSGRLHELVDLDDGRATAVGKVIYGNLDFAGDSDFYQLPLQEGKKINVHASSISIDPFILITRAGDSLEQLVGDDDSGGGVFGLDAEMSFIAPDSGTYLILVADSTGYSTGGYSLEVRELYEGAPTPMVPNPTPKPVRTEFGEMVVYKSVLDEIAFLYPGEWTREAVSRHYLADACAYVTDCFSSGNSLLTVVEEDLNSLPISTLDEYLDLYIDFVESSSGVVTSVEDFQTDSGLDGKVISSTFGGLYELKRLVIVYDGVAFNLTYIVVPDEVENLWPMAEFSFSTFEVLE